MKARACRQRQGRTPHENDSLKIVTGSSKRRKGRCLVGAVLFPCLKHVCQSSVDTLPGRSPKWFWLWSTTLSANNLIHILCTLFKVGCFQTQRTASLMALGPAWACFPRVLMGARLGGFRQGLCIMQALPKVGVPLIYPKILYNPCKGAPKNGTPLVQAELKEKSGRKAV